MSSPKHLIDIRRDIHAHPELGYEEFRTSRLIQAFLTQHGVDTVGGLAKGTGLLGYLPATVAGGKTVALRADMDALPIFEETNLPYASQTPGKMHACGHDGHTTILMGTAERLAAQPERKNNMIFVFQPAEEGGAGGKAMCEDGALNGTRVPSKADIIFGLHGSPSLHVGQVGTRVGAMMASADQFELTFHGKGGHAAMPHTAVDPIVVAAHFITAVQSVVSRGISPLESGVVTIGVVQAGTAHNIIPETAKLSGTVRALDPAVREFEMKRVGEIAHNIAQTFGASAHIEWGVGYPVTVNDAGAVDQFRSILGSNDLIKVHGGEVEPVMGGEDFSFYGHHVPACFFWLGLLPPGTTQMPNLHHPKFDFNDEAIEFGIEAMVTLASAAL